MSENTKDSQGRPASPFARSGGGNDQPIFRQDPFRTGGPNRPSAPAADEAVTKVAARREAERPTSVVPAPDPASVPGPLVRAKQKVQAAAAGVGVGGGAQAAGSANSAAPVPGMSAGSAASASAPAAARTKAAPAKRTRKARLRLSRIDPWSVMKTALMFSIAFGILSVVAMWVLWGVLQSSGAFDSINRSVNDLLATPNSPSSFDLGRYITGSRVMGYTALIAAADVVIFTALATLFSFLYNLSATVLGGLEVTLAED